MKRNASCFFDGKYFDIERNGIINNLFIIKIDNEEVYNRIHKNGINPIDQILFYYKEIKYTIYFSVCIEKHRNINCLLINHCLCLGEIKCFETQVRKYRKLIKGSKYFLLKSKVIDSLIYTMFLSLYLATFIVLVDKIRNEIIIWNKFRLIFFISFIVNGFVKWNQYNRIELNGIDDIDFDQIN